MLTKPVHWGLAALFRSRPRDAWVALLDGADACTTPVLTLEDPAFGPFHPDLVAEVRMAPAMIGLGLLEALPDATLEAFADPEDADGDGISGRVQRVVDAITGERVIGRFGWKATQRTLFLRSLRMRRMTPVEVNARLQEDGDVHVIDLRHQYDVDVLPRTVPGALRIPMEFIDQHAHRIPRTSDIILYCS